MEAEETKIKPPTNPLTAHINGAIVGFYLDWFIKRFLPAFKVEITSGYRDPNKNKSVGGAENSAHLHNLARDIVLRYPNGQLVPKAQAKAVFDEFIKPNWPGFALWEEDHIHLNLSRKITEYAGIMSVAAMGVVGFAIIQSLGGSKDD